VCVCSHSYAACSAFAPCFVTCDLQFRLFVLKNDSNLTCLLILPNHGFGVKVLCSTLLSTLKFTLYIRQFHFFHFPEMLLETNKQTNTSFLKNRFAFFFY